MRWWVSAAVSVTLWASSGLEVVKQEPNLEKRSEKALEYADELLTAVRGELDRQDWKGISAQLGEFREAVDLSFESLKATGKSARRSPKYFKRAEMRLRELGRRLRGLQRDVDLDDRPKMDELVEHVDAVQDELVAMTMGVRSK